MTAKADMGRAVIARLCEATAPILEPGEGELLEVVFGDHYFV